MAGKSASRKFPWRAVRRSAALERIRFDQAGDDVVLNAEDEIPKGYVDEALDRG